MCCLLIVLVFAAAFVCGAIGVAATVIGVLLGLIGAVGLIGVGPLAVVRKR